ncbi:MAG: alkaline phosphatase family protein [Candidatus Nanohalobium sp.]
MAFDGLDKDLIQEFDLEHVVQEEFGSIDNDDQISVRSTSELFASFITGETHDQHGIEGLTTRTNESVQFFEDRLPDNKFFNKFKGIRESFYSTDLIDGRKRKPEEKDLEVKAIFEEIDDSRAMYVPGYNPSKLWKNGFSMGKLLSLGNSKVEVEDFLRDREFEVRKRKLFSELDNEIISPRKFLMCHFHFSDWMHHLYGDKKSGNWDRRKLLEIYKESDNLAKEILEKAEEASYDYVIFMSDHGLPDEEAHNENAFYSCNKELFGEETPHITDFYDKILELSNSG